MRIQIAGCHRRLGDLTAAKDRLADLLETRPFLERARYEMALVLAEQGRGQEALEHLQVALEVWSDADPEFKWGREARELYASLTGGSDQ